MQAAPATIRKKAGRPSRAAKAEQQRLQQATAAASCAPAVEEDKPGEKAAAALAQSVKKKPAWLSRAEKLRLEQEQAAQQVSDWSATAFQMNA